MFKRRVPSCSVNANYAVHRPDFTSRGVLAWCVGCGVHGAVSVGVGVGRPSPSCLVVRPFVVALPTVWSFVCAGAASCAYSCSAHVRPCAQGRCGRCPPGSGVMSIFIFLLFFTAVHQSNTPPPSPPPPGPPDLNRPQSLPLFPPTSPYIITAETETGAACRRWRPRWRRKELRLHGGRVAALQGPVWQRDCCSDSAGASSGRSAAAAAARSPVC